MRTEVPGVPRTHGVCLGGALVGHWWHLLIKTKTPLICQRIIDFISYA